MRELKDDILRGVIRKRPKNSHKGNFGRLLVVGGNAQYGGAAILASQGAIYAGAGLVTVATDFCNHAALHACLPEAMVLDWTEDFETENYDVVVIGCGLGLEESSRQLLAKVLVGQTERQKLVIDGSAIGIYAAKHFDLKFPENVVFTPHQMELQRLTGLEITTQTDLELQAFVDERKVMLVAKSFATRIFVPQAEAQLLTVGSPAQATGGMGDTLAGMIGGFLAQFSHVDAVAAAVYLHSKIASDLAESQYVVLPSQIVAEIPRYMKRFEG